MKEKRKNAVALKYNLKKDAAPVVTASGRGMIADRLMSVAKENNIPIVEDESLANLLSEIQLNESIPEELYQAVAAVFAFIYQVDEHAKNSEEK